MMLLACVLMLSFAACKSEKEKAVEQLSNTMEQLGIEYPVQVDEATLWTNTTFEEPFMVYHYTLDEDDFGEDVDVHAAMEGMEYQLKQLLRESLKEAVHMDNTKDLLTKAGLGVRYQYTFSNSGKVKNIDFSADEVAAL